MSDAWFFLSPRELNNNPVDLDSETVRHLRALRLQENDLLVLSDGKGQAWQARLVMQGEGQPRAVIIKELEHNNEPPLDIILLAGVCKGEKMDHLIRAAVELGVKKIVPVLTERTVVQLPRSKREEKAARWRKLAVAAATICRRSYLPTVDVPLDFDEMITLVTAKELVIVPWEEERERGLYSFLQSVSPPSGEVLVFTGPEGGIGAGEMERLTEIPSVHVVSLGPRIMSAQHAPLAAIAVIMAVWGDLG